MHEFSIRPMEQKDLPLILNYWASASRTDLDRMGVDPAKMMSPTEFGKRLQEMLKVPQESAQSFVVMWLIDGNPVGFSSLKNIVRGDSADIHLHIASHEFRGKGFGKILFCLTVVEFYKQFRLKSMTCEPKSTNPMPNRMLAGIGFPLAKTYLGTSPELTDECWLNSYDIRLDIAQRYLNKNSRA